MHPPPALRMMVLKANCLLRNTMAILDLLTLIGDFQAQPRRCNPHLPDGTAVEPVRRASGHRPSAAFGADRPGHHYSVHYGRHYRRCMVVCTYSTGDAELTLERATSFLDRRPSCD